MADYVNIENYSRLGRMGISRTTLKTITRKAVSNVAGASVAQQQKGNKRASFQVAEPIEVFLRKDGLVDIKIAVNLQQDVKVVEMCEKIQNEVVTSFKAMVETVPVSVNIKILKVG